MLNKTVTISVGRNVRSTPMRAREWQAFTSDVARLLEHYGAVVYVDGATSVGTWGGVREASCTWVATLSGDKVKHLRARLAQLAGAYCQDAIAMTVGKTELLEGVW